MHCIGSSNCYILGALVLHNLYSRFDLIPLDENTLSYYNNDLNDNTDKDEYDDEDSLIIITFLRISDYTTTIAKYYYYRLATEGLKGKEILKMMVSRAAKTVKW